MGVEGNRGEVAWGKGGVTGAQGCKGECKQRGSEEAVGAGGGEGSRCSSGPNTGLGWGPHFKP